MHNYSTKHKMALILFIYSIAYVVTAFQASEQMNKTSPHLGEQTHGSKGAVPRFSWGHCYTDSCGLSSDTYCVFPQFCDCSAPPSPHTVLLPVTPQLLRAIGKVLQILVLRWKITPKGKKQRCPKVHYTAAQNKPKSQSICRFNFHSFRKYSTSQPEEQEILHVCPPSNRETHV